MLRIQRSSSGQVVFTLSGRIDEEHIAELKALLSSEANGCPIVLDLKDVTLAGPVAVDFLEQCEADGITLRSCAPYIREWITRQRRER
jgi:anti-anti-sigma regulatory factor